MTEIDTQRIGDAATILQNGGLVAMPTETVYGLAADAGNDRAVAKIFSAKGRPQFNPLIVHVGSPAMAAEIAHINDVAQQLIEAFWPGALTLVLPRKETARLSHLVTAGLDSVGVRMPAHKLAQALIKATARPLAAPSANPSGTVSPTSAQDVRDGLGRQVDMILDGGSCTVGVESSIVKIGGDRVMLLRPGGVSRDSLENVLGRTLSNPSSDKIIAPGMMKSHYAPGASMRLNVETPAEDEIYIGFGSRSRAETGDLNLSVIGDVEEAAANLFAMMRRADRLCKDQNKRGIAVAPVPLDGLGEAINDRLTRAAAPKDT